MIYIPGGKDLCDFTEKIGNASLRAVEVKVFVKRRDLRKPRRRRKQNSANILRLLPLVLILWGKCAPAVNWRILRHSVRVTAKQCKAQMRGHRFESWFKMAFFPLLNPLTPTSDWYQFSPKKLNTLSSRLVKRIEKFITRVFYVQMHHQIPITDVKSNVWQSLRGLNIEILRMKGLSSFSNCNDRFLGEQGCRSVVRALASHQCVPPIRYPDTASQVGWVCWFSSLLREVFLRVLRFFPLLKN